jgi:hypothetical protein
MPSEVKGLVHPPVNSSTAGSILISRRQPLGVVCLIANIVCLILLVGAIESSQKRLVSFGYALGGFLLVVALGFAAIFLLMPARGSVVDVNEVLDKVGDATQIAAPIAAVWAASIPPRRVKA